MVKCNKCGLSIRLIKAATGKWHPANMDGSAHYDACSAARVDAFKKDGVPFMEKDARGLQKKNGDRLYLERRSPVIPARDVSLPQCACQTPPWEPCAHAG